MLIISINCIAGAKLHFSCDIFMVLFSPFGLRVCAFREIVVLLQHFLSKRHCKHKKHERFLFMLCGPRKTSKYQQETPVQCMDVCSFCSWVFTRFEIS